MLWFLLMIIFLALWLVERGRSKKEDSKGYQDGLADGYQMAKDQVREVRASKNNDTEVINLFLSVGDETSESAEQTKSVSSRTTTGVLYEEAPIVNSSEQPDYQNATNCLQ